MGRGYEGRGDVPQWVSPSWLRLHVVVFAVQQVRAVRIRRVVGRNFMFGIDALGWFCMGV
jgi:hypothetical protein